MALLRMTPFPIRNWHDAAILLVLIVVIYIGRIALTLAKRVTKLSLPKREAEFKEK